MREARPFCACKNFYEGFTMTSIILGAGAATVHPSVLPLWRCPCTRLFCLRSPGRHGSSFDSYCHLARRRCCRRRTHLTRESARPGRQQRWQRQLACSLPRQQLKREQRTLSLSLCTLFLSPSLAAKAAAEKRHDFHASFLAAASCPCRPACLPARPASRRARVRPLLSQSQLHPPSLSR